MSAAEHALHLACACDAGYAPHAAAMLDSVLSHGDPARWTLHLLHAPDLPANICEQLAAPVRARGARLQFHQVDDQRVAALQRMERIGSVMWYRMFLPELLPEVARVLYVDCDILAATDLVPLLTTDLQGLPLGAVRNVFDPPSRHRPQQLGLTSARDYFNSGVLLMDLAAWRREGWAQRVLDIARQRHSELLWPDQDALNLAFAGRWLPLHPRWNAMNSLYYFDDLGGAYSEAERAEAISSPGLLHFEGPGFCKPWNALCKHPYRAAYFASRARTAWPQVQLQDDTLRTRLLRLLPMRQIPRALALVERIERGVARRWRRLTGQSRAAA
ncbi:MAG TPA: glycosyltransferase family 8 protein [Nevskiaceae bacterium]|nr:glycosyltransferase family 8 protein [Nevskiaceae bacterium]